MTEMAPGAVTIADLYRELIGMRTEVAKALERLEILDRSSTDHEARLRLLEIAGARLAGKLAVMAGGTGIASGWIGYLLGHFIH